ncbi:hypothetical protein SEA_CIRCINUS_248 [Streptomyces phage Circinus]|uniref:DUF8033 domain-containing protein n=1 Tax=Streptomyces phage Circinus TaxID=2562189 RepID=A0A4D6E0Y7_9CAUD|nr:hypothetical protein SEA_CIRCINUS_3 [Streptomyces phage Circinus]QBZ72501.1 hypothetical protein SEA_CIRCINUS_248 [Streptomyces phage Circinus]
MGSVWCIGTRRVRPYGYRPGHARRFCDGWCAVKRLTTRSSWMDFRDTLRARESFTTSGALTGVSKPGYVTMGQLPAEYRASAQMAVYVVYSYRTPIAWCLPSGDWVCPDTRYSVTTSRHQSKVRTAVSQLDIERWN